MEKSKTNIPSKVNFAFKQSLTALAKKKKKKKRGTCHLRKFGYVATSFSSITVLLLIREKSIYSLPIGQEAVEPTRQLVEHHSHYTGLRTAL